jgi:hypothetical protein
VQQNIPGGPSVQSSTVGDLYPKGTDSKSVVDPPTSNLSFSEQPQPSPPYIPPSPQNWPYMPSNSPPYIPSSPRWPHTPSRENSPSPPPPPPPARPRHHPNYRPSRNGDSWVARRDVRYDSWRRTVPPPPPRTRPAPPPSPPPRSPSPVNLYRDERRKRRRV